MKKIKRWYGTFYYLDGEKNKEAITQLLNEKAKIHKLVSILLLVGCLGYSFFLIYLVLKGLNN